MVADGPRPPQERAAAHLVRVADLGVGYSPRETRFDEDHLEALMEVLDRLPPIIVQEGTLRVIDGLHRAEAFRRAGRSEIPALTFCGDEAEAVALAVQANTRHGKPLNRRERQVAAALLVRRWPERSDRWVGDVCGLSHSTVARIRQAAQVAEAPVRTGRDGRRRPVDAGPGQMAVDKVLTEGSARSVRAAAEAAGVAASTAHRLASRRRTHGDGEEVAVPDKAATGVTSEVPPGGGTPSSDARPVGNGPGTPDALFDEGAAAPGFLAWLERTAVSPADLSTHLSGVPVGRVYEVVDECRRRAHIWRELAESLERLAPTAANEPPEIN